MTTQHEPESHHAPRLWLWELTTYVTPIIVYLPAVVLTWLLDHPALSAASLYLAAILFAGVQGIGWWKAERRFAAFVLYVTRVIATMLFFGAVKTLDDCDKGSCRAEDEDFARMMNAVTLIALLAQPAASAILLAILGWRDRQGPRPQPVAAEL